MKVQQAYKGGYSTMDKILTFLGGLVEFLVELVIAIFWIIVMITGVFLLAVLLFKLVMLQAG